MTEPTAVKPAFRWLPLILLVVLGALWGGNPSFSKALAIAGVSPFAAVFWQTSGAGVLLLLVCLVRRTPLQFGRKHLIYFVFIGVIGFDVAYTTVVFTVAQLSAGYVSILILISPMLTYLIALILRMEPIVTIRAAGVVVGLAGAGFLVVPEGSLPSRDLLPLALFAFIIPLAYAAANIFAEIGRPANTDNVALAMGTMFAAAVGALIGTLVDNSFYPAWQNFGHTEAVLAGFALSAAIAYLIFYTIIKMAGAVYLGQVGYLATLFGVTWGILFFAEKPNAWLWLAALLVAAGVALVNLGKPKPAAKVPDR